MVTILNDAFILSRSGSSVRLDHAQHEELLLTLDPELLMQAAQRHSSNNLAILNSNSNTINMYDNDGFDDESSMDSYNSSTAHLSPNGNGMTRKGLFLIWSQSYGINLI